MRILQSAANIAADLRFAARRLAATPGWTMVASGTLALGLAVSLVSGILMRDVLLRPLPFPNPDRLVRLIEQSENGFMWWPSYPNARTVISVALDRIADSCGYGVPRYRYEAERSQLLDWAERKGPEGVVTYRDENNVTSIDGLPGLTPRPPR